MVFHSVLGTQHSVLFFRFTLGLSAYHSLTIYQHCYPKFSLKMVSAAASKELQNVLPNGNPSAHRLLYTAYRSNCICSPSARSNSGRGWGVRGRDWVYPMANPARNRPLPPPLPPFECASAPFLDSGGGLSH